MPRRAAPPPDEPADRKPFLLRLPPGLMSELKTWASHELRSLNGHIEFLLRRALVDAGRAPRPSPPDGSPAPPPEKKARKTK